MNTNTLHYLTIIGNQHVGKSKVIKNIISGKYVHPLLPTITKDAPFKINNKYYNYIKNPFVLFKLYKNIKKTAYIVVNTANIDSLTSIPFWYNKIRSNHTSIYIILINKDQDIPSNLILLHHVIQFCTLHKIKLININ